MSFSAEIPKKESSVAQNTQSAEKTLFFFFGCPDGIVSRCDMLLYPLTDDDGIVLGDDLFDIVGGKHAVVGFTQHA